MTKAARPPRWFPPLSVAVCILLVVLCSITWHFVPIRITGQALALLIILRFFCYWPPMVRWVQSMPTPHRVIFALMLAGMIFGHYTLNGRTFFPYVAWEIFPFAQDNDPVTCQQFIATTAKGNKVRLLAEQLFPSIVQIDRVESLSPEATDDLAHALAKIYNELHADDPVRQIDLYVMAVKLHPPASESRALPSCELLKHYNVSSAQ